MTMINHWEKLSTEVLHSPSCNILNSDPFRLNAWNPSQSANICVINRYTDHFTIQVTTAVELGLIILTEKHYRQCRKQHMTRRD